MAQLPTRHRHPLARIPIVRDFNQHIQGLGRQANFDCQALADGERDVDELAHQVFHVEAVLVDQVAAVDPQLHTLDSHVEALQALQVGFRAQAQKHRVQAADEFG